MWEQLEDDFCVEPPLGGRKKQGYMPEIPVPEEDSRMNLLGFQDASVILGGGVYALCYRGTVVYIGQSKACIQRIATHRAQRGRKTMPWLPVKGITFDEIHILPCKPEDRDRIEREMIIRYRPKHNIVHKPSRPVPHSPLTIEINGRPFVFSPPEPIERRAF